MKNIYVVFWVGDGCSRESANAYYSTVVEAESEREAIIKVNPFNGNEEDRYSWEEELSEWSAMKTEILR